jgi:hypothetical protein
MAALERIPPAIEALSDAPESPETVDEQGRASAEEPHSATRGAQEGAEAVVAPRYRAVVVP